MYSTRDRIIAFLMILPSIVMIAIFVYGFIGQNIYFSATDWGVSQGNQRAALSGEKELLGDCPNALNDCTNNYEILMSELLQFPFRNSLVNTFFFTFFFLAGCLTLGFILAVLLDQNVVGEGFFRTIFLYPMSLSLVVTGTIWRWLLQPNGGINVLPEKITHIKVFGQMIFPKGLRRGPLEYAWMESTTLKWPFNWTDVPEFATYIGLSIIALLALGPLFRYRWRFLAQIGSYLVILSLGSYLSIWKGIYKDLSFPVLHEQIPYLIVLIIAFGTANAVMERNWKLTTYVVAAVLVWGAFSLGVWDQFWLPLKTPAAELQKGYQVALDGIVIAAVWQMAGYVMALFLAGIRGIPEELREAARVDGCAEWQVYQYIILPNLRSVALSAIIILGHISLKAFDLVFAMAGPDRRTTRFPSLLLYTEGFRGNKFAFGSAIGVILLMLISTVIIPYLWMNLRGEERK